MITSWRKPYFLALCAITLVVLAFPVLVDQLVFLQDGTRSAIRRTVNLALENNIGAWWSGAVLFLAAMHFYDGYWRYREANAPSLSRAWLVLAGVMAALSLDEVGSLHERADMLLAFGTWWSLLPFALILVGAVAWAFWQLWASPVERRFLPYIFVGFACFGTVAFQEHLEHALSWEPWMIPLRTAVEEGTEFLGMFLLIGVGMRHSGGVFGTAPSGARSTFNMPATLPPWVLAAVIAALPVTAFITARLDQGRGHPSDWLAAMLFLIAAFAAVGDPLSGTPSARLRRIVTGGLLIAASALSVQLAPLWTATLFGAAVSVRLAALSVLLAVIAGTVGLATRRDGPPGYVWLLLAGITALAAFASDTLFSTYLLTGCGAFLAYCLASPSNAGRLLLRPAKEPIHGVR